MALGLREVAVMHVETELTGAVKGTCAFIRTLLADLEGLLAEDDDHKVTRFARRAARIRRLVDEFERDFRASQGD